MSGSGGSAAGSVSARGAVLTGAVASVSSVGSEVAWTCSVVRVVSEGNGVVLCSSGTVGVVSGSSSSVVSLARAHGSAFLSDEVSVWGSMVTGSDVACSSVGASAFTSPSAVVVWKS